MTACQLGVAKQQLIDAQDHITESDEAHTDARRELDQVRGALRDLATGAPAWRHDIVTMSGARV